MLERFSTRARAVLVLAQQEAHRLGHEAVAPEHLLAALIAEGRGVAARTLSSLSVGIDTARSEALAAYGRAARTDVDAPAKVGLHGQARPMSLPYSATAKRVLEHAGRESSSLGDEVIATEHLLLAFTADVRSAPAQLLERIGRHPSDVRERVLELRAARIGPGESTEAPPPPTVPNPRRPPGSTGGSGSRPSGGAGGPPRRLPRSSLRPYEPSERGRPEGGPAERGSPGRTAGERAGTARSRWSLSHLSGQPPGRLADPRAVEPRCPGCGGLLAGRLAVRRLPVGVADTPDATAGGTVADTGRAETGRPDTGRPDTGRPGGQAEAAETVRSAGDEKPSIAAAPDGGLSGASYPAGSTLGFEPPAVEHPENAVLSRSLEEGTPEGSPTPAPQPAAANGAPAPGGAVVGPASVELVYCASCGHVLRTR